MARMYRPPTSFATYCPGIGTLIGHFSGGSWRAVIDRLTDCCAWGEACQKPRRGGAGTLSSVLVADLRHFLDLPDDTPGPARRLAGQLGSLVKAATADEPGAAWVSALTCRRRPGNRRCAGRMIVRRADPAGPIAWECSSCGDAGHISGWEGTPYDLSGRRPHPIGGGQLIRVTDQVAQALRELRLPDPDCERVVYRARGLDDDIVVLTGTGDELDELIANVAAEANHEPDRRRRQRLDTAFEMLGTATRNPGWSSATQDGVHRAPTEPARPAETTVGLPELDVARVQRWCAARVPDRARHQVRVECQVAAAHLTIVERRAPWREDFGPEWTSSPIARLHYAKTTRTWTLYRSDHQHGFRTYDRTPASPHIDDLLTEIGRDPTGTFWG